MPKLSLRTFWKRRKTQIATSEYTSGAIPEAVHSLMLVWMTNEKATTQKTLSRQKY